MTEHEQMLITKYDLLFESRLTKVETSLENMGETMKEIKSELRDIRTDFKWLFGLMLAFSSALLGVMGKGFHWY